MEFINSDYHARLRAALSSRFASVSWQRCQFLLQRNAMAFVPRAEGTADLRVILDSPERTEAECRLQLVAEKYKAFPRSHWLRLRTSNLVERLKICRIQRWRH